MLKEITITERQSGNVFIREVKLPSVGDAIPSHCHKYDHTMFFMKGKGKITTTRMDGSIEKSVIAAPADVLVEKGVLHGVEALTSNVYFCCVFPHRDSVGTITDEPTDRIAYY